MKKYIMPEMKISKFTAEEIIMTSTVDPTKTAAENVQAQLEQTTNAQSFFQSNWDSMMK